MNNYSFSDLRCHYQTGRSYVISGVGRYRNYGYRIGIQCDLGDIERSGWCQMVKELIRQEGEQELQKQLLQHLKDHNYAKESVRELEFKALELHADRIFDNEVWVDFLKFNRKYRPEVAEAARLVWVITDCCNKPGQITKAMLDSCNHDDRVCCPHCGRWAHYKIITTNEMEERTNGCESL